MFHFLLNPYSGPTKANYQHSCVVFAEGLKALRIDFTANINYYPDSSGNYLFQEGVKAPDAYIVTSAPEDFVSLLQTGRLIIFDAKDEWVRHKSKVFLPAAHRYYMTTCTKDSNIAKPLCFAASNRMLAITNKPQIPWSERSRQIAWTHRVDNHYLRNLAKAFYERNNIQCDTYIDNFGEPQEPAAQHEWNHTGRRHSPKYFEFLRTHRYLDAHGGYSTQAKNRIIQWDSWKVWEGFLSGMLVITADLDYYNILLPFKLIPFKHYIPVRYHEMEGCYKALFSLPDAEQEAIAIAGRDFVRANYNPESMAKYITNSL